jgi:hypothetical protein
VIDQGGGRIHFVSVSDASGDTQVYHARETENFEYNGGTCTLTVNVTVANGQTRHGYIAAAGSCPPQSS